MSARAMIGPAPVPRVEDTGEGHRKNQLMTEGVSRMRSDKPTHDEMYCSSCGSIIKRAAEICVHCGVRVAQMGGQSTTTMYSDKSRMVAGILGILVGAIGVHRFYLGNIGIGILQIIVTLITFGIGSLWGFIEGIIIITGGKWRDGDGLPLKPHGMQ